ncbi:hypothetical protein HELRODRAFT_166687 [Helobdella robusta]|uniref:EB domain-containing protein n=1 Tax=Helobdella robusta TaxID=6412 RepID=T1EYD1_HELRO|nr:hypothetical protein HELRODRAFT_166687 [Helobdella robusta]ESO11671.1 hypothetical protein HELRODRAFT_166687 [Helobdella robusta]
MFSPRQIIRNNETQYFGTGFPFNGNDDGNGNDDNDDGDVGEAGCRFSYQCEGGSVCNDGVCICPTGFEINSRYPNKCVSKKDQSRVKIRHFRFYEPLPLVHAHVFE